MKKYSIFIYVFVLFFYAQIAFAADIFLGSDKSEVRVNDTFAVTVFINSAGVPVNSAEGTLSFPNDLLSVESVSMSGSVFSIWVEQPTFSNNAGIVSFNGGSPNPGFNGARGAVLRVNFKAKEKGAAVLSFNGASVYANDGLGTDVTSGRRGTSVIIGDSVAVPQPQQPSGVNTPGAPEITSVEMPDQDKWYSKSRAVFNWNVGGQITSAQLLLGSFPASVPTITYTPPIGNKEVSGLSDGISYLHVRFANSSGWGATAHRKIKIDTTAPTGLTVSSDITEDDYVALDLRAQDKTSGVQSYKVLWNGNQLGETSVEPSLNSSVNFVIPALPSGTQELSVRAYDRAGNFVTENISVSVPRIKTPKITEYSEEITKEGQITIKGTTYPLGDVFVYIKDGDDEPKKYPVKADDAGVFEFKSGHISHVGLASAWVVASRGELIQSEPSEVVYIKVNKSLVVRTGLFAIEVLMVLIPLILLLLLLMFTTYYGFHKFRVMRRRLLLDLDKTEDDSRKIFEVIKDDVKKSIHLFKKLSTRRKISDEEKEVLETLSKDVEQAEEYFEKRIEKIEREDL